jgi:predicted nucleotidyltransferase
MAIETLIKNKREEILRVAEKHGAGNIRIFGSVARGDTDSKSDLDLLVKMEKGRSFLDLVALWQELEELLDCKVDVITEGGLSPHLKDRILKEAIPL